jgi:hypothetical protein
MKGSKRKIGTLIATLGLAVTAGGVTAALAAGSSTPSNAPTSISSTPSVGDDGTADQGHGDVPAEQGEDQGENQGPGDADEDSNRGPGDADEDSHSGHDDGNSGHDDGNSGHDDGGLDG